MWVIIRWLRNNAYPLTTLFLFLFSFNLVLRYQVYQHSLYFNQSVSFFRTVDGWRSSLTQYFDLREENNYLKEENLILRKQLARNYFNHSPSFDSTFVDTITNGASRLAYRYHHATVIRNEFRKRDNYFYINQGSVDSIEVGMAVLSPLGAAGIVTHISDHYARVMSVLNSNFEITSWIPNIGLRQGAVKWDFKNTSSGIIDEINRSEAIKKGQDVLTSNYSSIFPPGTPIGKIDRVVNSEKSQYLQIRIRFATDFKRLNHVYCVKNLFSKTLDQLKTEELND